MVLVCVGRPPLHAHPTAIPPLIGAGQQFMLRQGCRESRGKEYDWNSICFYSLHKTLSLLSFSSRLSNISLPLLPSFSSQLWPSIQIPTEWDKERQWEGGERWWDASVSSHDHWEQRETTWLVCMSVFLYFSTLNLWECLCVLLCLFTLLRNAAQWGLCYLSLFFNAGGKTEEEEKH